MASKELIVKFGADISNMTKNLAKVGSNVGKTMSSMQKEVAKQFADMGKTSDSASKSIVKHFARIPKQAVKDIATATKSVDSAFRKMSASSNKAVSGIGKAFTKVDDSIIKTFTKAKNSVDKTFGKMKSTVSNVTSHIESKFKFMKFNMGQKLAPATKSLNKFKSTTSKIFTSVKNSVGKTFGQVTNKITKPFTKARSSVTKVFDKIKQKAQQSAEDVEQSFSGMSDKLKGALGGIAGAFAVDQISGFVDEQTENMKLTNKITTAFQSQKLSVEDANKTYKDFYGILGDYDTAVEASQLLVNMTNNQKEMAKWTEISKGVYATFGDALPIEGFIESANETAKVGKVTGSLADALNWAGINEDKFNEKLEKCKTEAQRQDLIMQTLNKTYSDSAKKFNENSSELVKYRNAQFELNNAKEKLATQIMPLVASAMSNFASLVSKIDLSKIVETIKKFKTEIGALAVVLGSVAIAWTVFSKGITIAGILSKVTGMLATAFTFLTSPVTLIIVGIGLLVGAFMLAYNKSETFRNAINNLKDKALEVWNSIKSGAQTFADTVGGAWDSLKEKCQPLIDIIQINLRDAFGEIEGIVTGVGNAFGTLKEKFQPVADLVGGAFGTAIQNLKDWFSELQPKLEDFATKVLQKVAWFIADVSNKLQTFKEKAGELWDKLQPLVTMIRDNLLKSLKSMKEPINTIVDSFKSMWAIIKDNLLPLLSNILMPIWDKFKGILKVVAGVIGGVLVVAIGIAMGVINGIAKAIGGIVKAFSGLTQIVSGVFELIVGIFTLNGEKIKGALGKIWDGVVNCFSGLWGAIKGFVKGLVDGVIEFFTNLWDVLVGHSIIPDTIDAIVEWFKGLWGKIKGFVKGVVDGVINFFKSLWNKVVTIFTTLKNWIASAWQWIKDKVVSIVKTWIQNTINNFNSLKNKIVSIFTTVKNWISNAWKWIKDKVVGFVTNIKDRAVSGFTTMKDKVVKMVTNIKDKVKEKFNDIVEFAKGLPKKLGDGIKNGGKAFANGFITMVNTATKWFLKGVNYIIKGVNFIYKKITGKDKGLIGEVNVNKWQIPKLAKGTNSWGGGSALVGEAGREIVSDPKLGTFVTPAPMILPLSKGASVLRNSKTEQVLKGMGINAYAKGKKEQSFLGKVWSGAKDIGKAIADKVGDVWDYVKDPSKLLQKVFDGINFGNFDGAKVFLDIIKAVPKKVISFAKDWLAKLFKDNEDFWNGNDNKEGWKGAKKWAKQALENAGYEAGTKAYKDFMTAYEIVGRYESNYQNKAWNKTDKNAQKGTPSKGWLQFIEPTFKDYKFKGYNKWLDPVHQAMAFINYANKKYGGALKVPGVKSVLAGGKYKPYAGGGLITQPTKALMGERGVEAVVPLSNAHALKPFGQAVTNAMHETNNNQTVATDVTYEFTIPVIIDGKEVAKATATFTKEELDKLEKRNKRRNGKK